MTYPRKGVFLCKYFAVKTLCVAMKMYGYVLGPGPQVYSLPPLRHEFAVPLKRVCANTLDVLKRLRANIAGRGRLGRNGTQGGRRTVTAASLL